jgi:Uma2 family endonuclease
VDNSEAGVDGVENEGMTLALARPGLGSAWTIDDLPDDGNRYELIDGSLLVAPPPAKPHFRATSRLRRLLEAACPPSLFVGECAGINLGHRRTYRVPDIVVVRAAALDGTDAAFEPADVVLVVEVLSPGVEGDDLILKRHQYGRAGIGHYWIVDQRQRSLTVLRFDGAGGYDEMATVRPGTTWHTDTPYEIGLDLADFV